MWHRSASREAFTLIELLVVVSIISLLASVVVAALNSAREKARGGAGEYFAAQVYHAAADQLIGSWNFDECSGTLAKDGSGYGNNGILTNGPAWSADTPTGSGCSVYLDGTDDHVRINNALPLSTIHGPSTISLWFKASTLVGTFNRIFSDNCFEWGIFTNGSTINGGAYSSVSGGPITTDKWYQAVLVHDIPNGDLTQTTLKLYIDGAQRAQAVINVTGNNGYNDNPFAIGADVCTAGSYFNGYVDDAKIYGKAFTSAEVQRQYASESAKALVKR